MNQFFPGLREMIDRGQRESADVSQGLEQESREELIGALSTDAFSYKKIASFLDSDHGMYHKRLDMTQPHKCITTPVTVTDKSGNSRA